MGTDILLCFLAVVALMLVTSNTLEDGKHGAARISTATMAVLSMGVILGQRGLAWGVIILAWIMLPPAVAACFGWTTGKYSQANRFTNKDSREVEEIFARIARPFVLLIGSCLGFCGSTAIIYHTYGLLPPWITILTAPILPSIISFAIFYFLRRLGWGSNLSWERPQIIQIRT